MEDGVPVPLAVGFMVLLAVLAVLSVYMGEVIGRDSMCASVCEERGLEHSKVVDGRCVCLRVEGE